MKLADKVAIITGGSKGIGFGCARVFARHGAKVVIAARNEKDGQAAEKELADSGYTTMFVPTDVTRHEQFESLVQRTIERFERVDCIVNNAGWHPPEMTIDQTSIEDFEHLVRLNLTSTFVGCKFAVPYLRQTRGSIINLSSEVGLYGQVNACSYAATKAGQLGLTRALALELAPEGIRVNAVCPAGVLTPLMEQSANRLDDPEAFLKYVDSKHPIGRMGTIDDIGEACAFLASNEASFITGQSICPDGGMHPR